MLTGVERPETLKTRILGYLFFKKHNKMKFRFTISQSIISQVQQEQKPFNLFLVKYGNKRNRLAKNLQTNPQVKLMQN